MASQLYEAMNQGSNLLDELNKLKAKGGNPNEMIQQMLNSGRVTQAQVNAAASRAQQLMQMLPAGVRR